MLLSRCCKEENGVAPPELPVVACTKASFAFFFETFFYQKLAYFFARGSMSRRLVFVKSSLLPAGRTLHSLCLSSVHMLEVHSSPLIPALCIQKTIFYCVCSHHRCVHYHHLINFNFEIFKSIFTFKTRRLKRLFDKYGISADMTYTILTSFINITTFVATTSYNIALPIIKSTFEMNLTLDAKSVTLVKGCVPASQRRCSGMFVLTSTTSYKAISNLA